MAKTVYTYLKLLRIHQWVKNLFVFAPIFFSFSFLNLEALINALYAFIGFSFIASSIYIINDWKDVELDRQHPTKKERPLASKDISVRNAFIVCIALLILGFSTYLFVLKTILQPYYYSFILYLMFFIVLN